MKLAIIREEALDQLEKISSEFWVLKKRFEDRIKEFKDIDAQILKGYQVPQPTRLAGGRRKYDS